MTYLPLAKRWKEVKARLATEGAKNVLYDSDLNALIDLTAIPNTLTGKDADSVDGYHGADLEKIANKGVANGYCELDANALAPLARIPDVLTGKSADMVDGSHRGGSRTLLIDDSTIHTTTSTGAVDLHTFITDTAYIRRVCAWSTRFYFRTTGAATAYVWQYAWTQMGLHHPIYTASASTTSTTTVSVTVIINHFFFLYTNGQDPALRLRFRTSDAAVAAEVSREICQINWGWLLTV